MKKSFLIFGICALLFACTSKTSSSGGSDSVASATQNAKEQSSSTDTNANKTGAEPAGTSNALGAKLMAASDCYTCHKAEDKLVGPSFKDIAHKYPATEANIDTLANKVIKGGKGNWGEVPMTPHPNISVADSKEMVKYILATKQS